VPEGLKRKLEGMMYIKVLKEEIRRNDVSKGLTE